MAQQREPLLYTGEYEWPNDLIGGIELGRDTPETSPITEHAKPETELARDRCSPEELPHDEFQTLPRTKPVVQVLEQINVELDNLRILVLSGPRKKEDRNGSIKIRMDFADDKLNSRDCICSF
ncbi:hypothetical protein OIU76_024159 [Salix suchowensis]|nr:hypothetical protein OIU76_024159 [Salix suchowensis]